MVAFFPLRTMGVLISLWFCSIFSSMSSSLRCLTSASKSLSLQFWSMRFSSPPMACLMLRSSPLLIPFSVRLMGWYLMPRSLKYRSAFLVSKHLGFPNIWIFNLSPPSCCFYSFCPVHFFFFNCIHCFSTILTIDWGALFGLSFITYMSHYIMMESVIEIRWKSGLPFYSGLYWFFNIWCSHCLLHYFFWFWDFNPRPCNKTPPESPLRGNLSHI